MAFFRRDDPARRTPFAAPRQGLIFNISIFIPAFDPFSLVFMGRFIAAILNASLGELSVFLPAKLKSKPLVPIAPPRHA